MLPDGAISEKVQCSIKRVPTVHDIFCDVVDVSNTITTQHPYVAAPLLVVRSNRLKQTSLLAFTNSQLYKKACNLFKIKLQNVHT